MTLADTAGVVNAPDREQNPLQDDEKILQERYLHGYKCPCEECLSLRRAKGRARWRIRYYKDPVGMNLKAKQWRDRNLEKVRRLRISNNRKSKSGWTQDQFEEALRNQKNRCYICLVLLTSGAGRTGACADHCHATKKRRAVLCGNCNSGLGFFKDSSFLLRMAANYVDGFE